MGNLEVREKSGLQLDCQSQPVVIEVMQSVTIE